MRIAIPGRPTSKPASGTVSMSGNGVYNARTGRSSLRMSISVPGHGSIALDGSAWRAHATCAPALFSAQTAAGQESGSSVEAAGGGFAARRSSAAGDLRQQLKMLQAVSDDVEDLGEIEVHGVSATAYRGTVDYDRYAGAAPRRR